MKFGKKSLEEVIKMVEEFSPETKGELRNHKHCDFELVFYGNKEDWALECVSCCQVIIDSEAVNG